MICYVCGSEVGADGSCACNSDEDCAVLRCMGVERNGERCKAVATVVGDDKWFCTRHAPKEREWPGDGWEEFLPNPRR